ncbi:alanine racemase [Actinokineospora globicatena]|uniref:alanine racemase n=1 Tax=Actinokineospora globicatena TaxID=103729 RepID=UPI003D7F9C39
MSRAEVGADLDALRHNVSLLVRRAAGAESMAVVKADGCGHGVVPVAKVGGLAARGAPAPASAIVSALPGAIRSVLS